MQVVYKYVGTNLYLINCNEITFENEIKFPKFMRISFKYNEIKIELACIYFLYSFDSK